MANTVYIFGAGASRSMGAPLLKDFIDRADDLRQRSRDVSAPDFRLIFEVLNKRLPILHAKSNQDIQNIETVFNLIEMGQLLERFPGTEPSDIPDLSRAIRTVLAETVELSCQFRYDRNETNWLPPTGYLTVADHLFDGTLDDPQNAALITFNYDLGLECALYWRNRDIDYGLSAPIAGAVPLLKLHGSLNWVRCAKCETLRVISMRQIFEAQLAPRSASREPRILRHLRIKPLLDRLTPHCADAPVLGIPALVPPSWNKTQYHGAFRRIWARAAKELSEAEQIVIIGYSCPEADAFFHGLLALGLAGGHRIRKVMVVDPITEVAQRVQRMLGPETRSRFEHSMMAFEDWAKDLPVRKAVRQATNDGTNF
jgi:hypothetical protein